MIQRVCGACGNLVPEWSNGVCQRCVLIEQAAKRFGDRRQRTTRRQPVEDSILPATGGVWRPSVRRMAADRDAAAELGLRARLEGINRLLADLFLPNIWLGRVLIDHGLAPDQVARWRKDPRWLLQFVQRLEAKVQELWTTINPTIDGQALCCWYGLGRPPLASAAAIADQLGVSFHAVITAQATFLAQLKTPAGRQQFAQALLAATSEDGSG